MTSPQRSLFPASGDDQGALLCTLELVARSGLQLVEVVWAIVRQRMPLEPGLQIFDRVHVGRVWRQKSDLAMSIDAVQIVARAGYDALSGCSRLPTAVVSSAF